MEYEKKTLVSLSNHIGSKVAYVQGGGGNTSLKTSKKNMLIKASGTFLADVHDETAFLEVDWPIIKANLDTCKTEADYQALLTASVLSDRGSARPSIETGFHAILECCTLHSHSVWANLLTCTVEGEALVSELFPSAIWVPYATPGLPLSREISDRIIGSKKVTLFLQNHGVVVSGPDVATTEAMHEAVTTTIRSAFPNLINFDEGDSDLSEVEIGGLLFPDQVIYHSNPKLAGSRAGRETMRACEFLVDRIPQAALTPNYINILEQDILKNMEAEKFRQKVATS